MVSTNLWQREASKQPTLKTWLCYASALSASSAVRRTPVPSWALISSRYASRMRFSITARRNLGSPGRDPRPRSAYGSIRPVLEAEPECKLTGRRVLRDLARRPPADQDVAVRLGLGAADPAGEVPPS